MINYEINMIFSVLLMKKNKFMQRFFTLSLLTILLMSMAGCAIDSPAMQTLPTVPVTIDGKGGDGEYRLAVGDEIEVKFFFNPEFNEKVKIREDGKISLQLLDEIQAAGLTPAELDRIITERYGIVLRQPEATVIVRETAAKKVFVGGEVQKPGPISYQRSLTALQAIVEAGGFAETAQPSSVIVIRTYGENKPIAAKIDLQKAIVQDPQKDILLLPSDIIFVPKSSIASVDKFVDQYIRKIIPIPVTIGAGF